MDNDSKICGYCNALKEKKYLLPCFHSFCGACIKDISANSPFPSKFLCPLCKTIIESSAICEGNLQNLTSESIDGVQNICSVCDEKVKATIKCLDCEELFCQKCSAIHLKMKPYRDHKLHSMGLKTRTGSFVTFCKDHKTEEVSSLCHDCCLAFCSSCYATLHQGHKFEAFTTAIAHMRKELSTTAKVHFQSQEESLQKDKDIAKKSIESLNSNSYDKEAACFNKLLDSVKDELADMVKSQVADVRKLEDCSKSRLEEERANLLSRLNSLESQERIFCTILNFAGSSELMARYDQMASFVDKISKSDVFWINKRIGFDHKRSDAGQRKVLERTSGSLFQISVPNLQVDFSAFNTALSLGKAPLVGIVAVTENKVWVASKKQIQLYEGSKRMFPVDLRGFVYDLTEDNYGNIFAACESSVLRIDPNGIILETIALPERKPSGITSRNGMLYVAFHEQNTFYGYRFSTKLWTEMQLDIRPNKVRIHPNGDIGIANRHSIVIMNPEFEICSQLKLPEVINSNNTSEQGLSFASSGHVFTIDSEKRTMYVASSGWNSLRAINHNLGSTLPSSLFVDSSNIIWIGSSTGDVYKGKLNYEDLSKTDETIAISFDAYI